MRKIRIKDEYLHYADRVAEWSGLTRTALMERTKKRPIVRARQVLFWVIKRSTTASYSEMGRAFKMNHSSILASIAKAEERRDNDIEFRQATDELLQRFFESNLKHGSGSPVYVYIAGPITNGDQFLNCSRAFKEGSKVMAAGHWPFVPHMSYAMHMVSPQGYEDWMKWDFAWLSRCAALIRLPGKSPGSDREVAYANSLGLPVYHSAEEFLAAHPPVS